MPSAVNVLAGIVGTSILITVAHATVMAAGGYGTAGAPLALALAGGLMVGSIAVAVACRERRVVVAVLLVLALAAGEAWALLMTAERTLEHRDAMQSPIRANVEARAKAERRVRDAEAAVTAIGTTDRMRRAVDAQAVADAATVAKAAERGCLANCRALLQAQTSAAAAEVAYARVEIITNRTKAETELAAARAAVVALPATRSSTPLADRLGLQGWQVDLAAAALASLAANGLGALLIAFAVHGRQHRTVPTIETTARDVTPARAVPRDAATEADWFARSVFRPATDGRIRLGDVKLAYYKWCASRGIEPLPDREIGTALNELFTGVGLYRVGSGADAEVVGVNWSRPLPVLLERFA